MSALKMHAEDVSAWVYKIMCHIHLNEREEALNAINKISLPRKKPSIEIYILKSKILWSLGMMEEGNKEARTAATMDTNHPEVKNHQHFCSLNVVPEPIDMNSIFHS
jgi:hypothetical protein